MDRNYERIEKMIKEGRALGVSVAPTHLCAFPGAPPGAVIAALRVLGFARVEETSSVLPYLVEERNNQSNITGRPVISTSCPRVVDLVRKEFPSLEGDLLGLPSPMVLHAADLRTRTPDGVVFIGPCSAKAEEAEAHPGSADIVMTFDDLNEWLNHRGMALGPNWVLGVGKPDAPSPLWAVASLLSLDASGIDECRALLARVAAGQETDLQQGYFIEALACEGGCLGGDGLSSAGSLQERRRAVIGILGMMSHSLRKAKEDGK